MVLLQDITSSTGNKAALFALAEGLMTNLSCLRLLPHLRVNGLNGPEESFSWHRSAVESIAHP